MELRLRVLVLEDDRQVVLFDPLRGILHRLEQIGRPVTTFAARRFTRG